MDLEIDPVIQLRADLMAEKITLKQYKRSGSVFCPVPDFLAIGDVWKSYVKTQVLSLKKKDHIGWGVYKRRFSDRSPELFCSAAAFVIKLTQWFPLDQDSPSSVETEV